MSAVDEVLLEFKEASVSGVAVTTAGASGSDSRWTRTIRGTGRVTAPLLSNLSKCLRDRG